ncbi:DEAD/DEAH box helicase family protein [Acinetobacter higginsii]|uniref:restriction endonuclease n=1 Tax=Acinetobacter higginsii TaxID=70347 RepID=UPI002675C8D7|nr:DEAD/DEAH box helicase family protein [Acinetobacter higginsii]MDO3664500.1 DEAD/DEAH box helicase family protein [Acinetobacter higginsii]
MKLQFDGSQSYQLDAIAAFIDLFEGQSLEQIDFAIEKNTDTNGQSSLFQSELGIGNAITLSPEAIYENMLKVQERNDIDLISQAEFVKNGMNFSVEMETGTGKTYVYLRTIFSLSQKYGFKKFIIVVPSVAIREGTLKNLQITAEHFKTIYNNIEFEHFVYNSQKPSLLRQFASSNKLQIMIINIDAFNKDVNKFHQKLERLSGNSPKDFVQATNPFVIIDEPQSVDNTIKAKDAISSLNPACIFRFSATHSNVYNLLYKLDPIKAYELRLVKQIVVASVIGENAQNDAYVKLLEVDNKKGIKAKVRIQVQTSNGIKQKDVIIKQYDDLYSKSGERAVYKHGFEVLDINADPDDAFIDFSSGRLRLGDEIGGIKEDITSIQIEKTISKHLDKELQLKGKGIKVLSLFFIDKVANYRVYDQDGKAHKGKFAELFEMHYQKLIASPKYRELDTYPVYEIHDGYFSADKKGRLKDTNGNTQADDETYSLIMKEKEKLLSVDTPLKFIFSHSALREGWDNPNVFQICTLNETKSISKKRQEIGRGLRLPVDNDGVRVFDDAINKLTIIANESYDQFASTLQKEYEDDCGVTFGKLPKLAFKGLVYVIDGQEKYIDRAGSERIYQELFDKGFIDSKGRIQYTFSPSNNGFTLGLSEEFSELEIDIIEHMKSFQLERYIKKDVKPKKLKLNKQIFLNTEFEQLWSRIKHKTTYQVEYSTARLITECSDAIKKMDKIEPVKALYIETATNITNKGIEGRVTRSNSSNIHYSGNLPDMLAYIQQETNLTRRTLVEIIKNSGRIREFTVNPQRFMDEIRDNIQRVLRGLMIEGIKYEKLTIGDTEWSMQLFKDDDLKDYFEDCINVKKSIYDTVIYESDVEREFALALDEREDIKLFVKLPRWFKVETPIGAYNPDWAIVKQDDETMYLVRETKSTNDMNKLRPSEKEKIQCGQAHFDALGVDFKVVIEATNV